MTKAGLVCGDILIQKVFPLLLGLAAVPSYWLYLYATHFVPSHLQILYPISGLLIAWCVFAVAYDVGHATPHLRETLRALLGYMGTFIRLVVSAEVLVIVCHLLLTLVLRACHADAEPFASAVSLMLGGYVLYRLAIRTFLWPSALGAEAELVRGQDLSDGADVARRAWRDG